MAIFRNGAKGALFLFTTGLLSIFMKAQTCPPDDGSLKPGASSTISGIIRVHNGLRGWTGLEIDPPICGQRELQLTFINGDSSLRYRETDALAGCHVKITGSIEESPTAHYSTDMFIQDGAIEPDSSCHPAPMKAASGEAIPANLQSYRATIFLDFGDTSKPIRVTAIRADKTSEKLTPWQAYVSTWLNASEDLIWAMCRDGFHLTDAATRANGKATMPDRSLKDEAGLRASDKPGESSITITCVTSSNQAGPATSNE